MAAGKDIEAKSVFERLNAINVNDHTEKKNGLTYLSWAWAWAEVKKAYPNAIYTVYENVEGWNYFTDGKTCWVKTGVTIEGLEHIEYLPVMDFKNKSIPYGEITSFDVNKAIQRSLTKACARHGLGLYVYAGEDLPEEECKAKTTKIEPYMAKAFADRCGNDTPLENFIFKAYKIKAWGDLTVEQAQNLNSNWDKAVQKSREGGTKNE